MPNTSSKTSRVFLPSELDRAPWTPGNKGTGYILKRSDGPVTLVTWATNRGRPQAAEAMTADGVDRRDRGSRFAIVKINASGSGTISDPLDMSVDARCFLGEMAAAIAAIDPRLKLEVR